MPLSAYVVDCGVYVDGKRLDGRFTHDKAIDEVRRRGEGFVWIGLHEPTDDQITAIAETYGLHELAVEDAVTAKQRPKLERYEDSLFMVLKTVTYVDHDEPTTATELIKTGEVMAFVGPDFIVTVRHGDHCGLHRVRERLEADPEQLALGPAAVLHAIADHIVDQYVAVTDAIEKDMDEIEAEVFEPRSAMDSEQIYVMKREVLELRRSVVPLVGPLRKLTEGYSSLVPHDVRSYFRDVDDHLSTVTERVTGFDELLTTLVDAVLAEDHAAAEQRHAQDHRVRGPDLGAHDGGGHLRHELRLHARAALAVRLPADPAGARRCCASCSTATSAATAGSSAYSG